MEKIQVEINGNTIEVEPGTRLLDACADLEIYIPTLCYHSALPGYAGCRLCVVEQHRRGWSKLVTACEYPLMRSGESFSTDSDMVWESRVRSAELLLARAPEARPQLKEVLGRAIETRYAELELENSKCVLCGLCYRLCHAQGTAAIHAVGRGAHKQIATPYQEANPDCIGCGSCAAICPTGAIAMREPPGKRAIWRQLFTLEKCPVCGKPHATQGMIEHMREKTELSDELIRMCPACRLKELSGKMTLGMTGD
ncbi:MAG: 2Fe-2S iron-sulfur cluster-binding protein [Spirochaetota bacterium]